MVSARSHSLLLALENALYTPPFFFSLLLLLLLTGAWWGGLIAVVVAAAASVAYQLLVNELNDVPTKAAVLSQPAAPHTTHCKRKCPLLLSTQRVAGC